MKLIKINGLYRTKDTNANGAYGYVENMEGQYWTYGVCDEMGENRNAIDALSKKYIAVDSLSQQFQFMKKVEIVDFDLI